jgi:hypothetical protein
VIKSRRLRWSGSAVIMKENRSAFKILTGRTIGKRHLGRSIIRWEDIIRMVLTAIGINTRNWVDSTQDRD